MSVHEAAARRQLDRLRPLPLAGEFNLMAWAL
jgi:hypothetical protein